MNWHAIAQTLWSLANSPLGITVAGSIALWLLNRIYAAKPAWQEFEGTIIAAVKRAEKAIPDDTQNAGAAKLNNALQYVLRVFEAAKGRRAKTSEKAAIEQGIQIMHAELEAAGGLAKAGE